MTNYTFAPKTLNLDVSWDEPAIWNPSIVPNAPDANVIIPDTVIPGLTFLGSDFNIAINSGESYAVDSLNIGFIGNLSIAGSLGVIGALSLSSPSSGITLDGGTLSVGELQDGESSIQGRGTIASSGTIVNSGTIYGSGLTLTAAGFNNTGMLTADVGNLTIDVTHAGGDANLSGGTLTGGSYEAIGGTLQLEIGGLITTDAAAITLAEAGVGNPTPLIEAVDPRTGDVLALQDTLRTITAAGSLDVSGTTYTSAGPLTIDGALTLDSAAQVSAPGLVVAAGGTISGSGTISGPITDGGTITAAIGQYNGQGGSLTIDGSVSGAGRLIVGPAFIPLIDQSLNLATLRLNAATSTAVSFASGGGTLVLADPQGFTGTITPAVPQFYRSLFNGMQVLDDDVVLAGITAGSVTGKTYVGNASGGTLTIAEGAAKQSLSFVGDFTTSSFTLSPGLALGAASSLQIAITPVPSSPTISLAGGPATQGLIVDTGILTVTGTAAAGTTVLLDADGVAQGSAKPQTASEGGTTAGPYQATLPSALSPGAHEITATAADVAGSAAASLALLVLPGPVDGTVTAAVSSAQFGALLDKGYGMQFIAGTQAIQLTDGTLSVGTTTGAALLQRLYEGLLDRSADTGGLVTYNAILSQAGPAAVATDLLASTEFTNLHGPLAALSDTQYVTLLYQGLLGRVPDPGGLTSYAAVLASGVSRGTVAADIVASPESQNHFAAATTNVWVPDPTAALITRLYETGLNRAPDLSGLAADVQAIGAGTTFLQIAAGIAASPEFRADHAGQNVPQLVTSLYENGLGRAPDPGGLQANSDVIQYGAGIGSALLGLASSPEAVGHLLRTV